MATAAQGWSNSDQETSHNQPEPVITYDHMTDVETIRYFRIAEKAPHISSVHLVMEEIIVVLLTVILLMLSF